MKRLLIGILVIILSISGCAGDLRITDQSPTPAGESVAPINTPVNPVTDTTGENTATQPSETVTATISAPLPKTTAFTF